MTAAAQDLSTPLLLSDAAEDAGASRARMQTAASDCKLQDKCFLSVGASESSDAYKKVQRKLVIACILCFIFMVIEVVGGYIAKSVAIMSDAAHMLSDVSAFLVSIFATWAATQPSSWHYSFGYHRAEILGALVSVLAIWAVTGALVFEAVQRTINPVRVDGKLMFFISVAGVVFNVLVALTLGVHAHLGHSHGPDGGCSGHGHSHGHSHDHSHDHSSSKHNHSHGHGCGHSHGHAHKHGSSGSSAHKHTHEHKHGDHAHHEHSHSAEEHSHQQQHKHNEDPQEEHSHHCHSHSHSHASSSGSSSCSSSAADLGSQQGGQATTAAWTAAAEADAGAGAGAGDVIVIDLPAGPAAGGPNCGLVGHAVSCRCTIARKSSHEIEVRCELPPPGVVLKAPAAGAAAAGGPSRPPSSHSHSHGHSHGHSHEAGSINLRSAVLHVIGDILQSIGVAIAGGLIWLNQDDPRWYLADPICTFIFSVVVLLTTKSILRDIVHVLMERTPVGVDVPAMSQVISDMAGVRDVHDLHVWNISTSTSPVLTAHVHIGPDADANTVLQQLEQYVRGIGIQHSTIQICNPLQSGPGQQES